MGWLVIMILASGFFSVNASFVCMLSSAVLI
ncbi:hypothetical protein HQQ94_20930 [Shewanella sp. VB17]|nr:hypothetical protein [Shewanella sp. VB17]